MEISTSQFKHCDVVKVTGRVDSSTAPKLAEEISRVHDRGQYKIVIDMTEMDFISSAGLRVLIATLKTNKRYNRGDLLLAKEKDRWVLVTVDGRTLVDPPPDWVQEIYALANFSERAWAALTRDAHLYVVDKRTLAVREALAPAGYRWCTTACYSSSELYHGEFHGDLAVEAEVRMIGCQMTMDLFEYSKDDMIEGIEIGGAATYIEVASKSHINLFI